MNRLRNSLYFSLTLQICIAAAIFAAAEEASLVLWTVPIAVATLFLIDLLGWLRPPTFLLNLSALTAFGFAFAEFRNEGEARLLAGGHLVAYLTWTFLLQSKDLQRMWWMFALSVLQVAMGAVLTIQPWFGAALFIYTASTVWTMSLLSLVRAALLVDPQLLAPDSVNRNIEVLTAKPDSRTSIARNGVRTDEHGRWISPRFLGGGVVTFLLMLVVGLAFFVLTPRVWIGQLNREAKAAIRQPGGSTTGFAQNVKLGDIGQVMESNELVMQVLLLDDERKKIPQEELAEYIGAEPLFRGAVLENYTSGGWTEEKYPESFWTLASESSGRNRIKLQITVQPIGAPVLFYPGSAMRAWTGTDGEQIVYNSSTLAIKSQDVDLEKPLTYFVSILPPQFLPNPRQRRRNRAWIRERGFPVEFEKLLITPSPRLTELARQILDKSDRDGEPDSEATARVLESYLRDSNEFNYTLDLSVDDPKIDPVEDFVFNRKRGHCEYFASALALMLRGVGIPTRLISGFKGAEYNTLTGELEVRDLHAHAWLEAFVEGGWIALDPTPGERDTTVANKAKETTGNLAERTRTFWFQGMNYNNSMQEQLVYGPIREIGSVIQSNFEGLMQGNLPAFSAISAAEAWTSAPGIVLEVLLLLGLGRLLWGARKRLYRWKRWKRDRDLDERRKVTVAFYARLMSLLHKLGFEEIQTLTPREFAQRAEDRFRVQFQQAGLSGIPIRLVEAFYGVRFGEQPLTADQLRVVNLQLDELERNLLQSSSHSPR